MCLSQTSVERLFGVSASIIINQGAKLTNVLTFKGQNLLLLTARIFLHVWSVTYPQQEAKII